jgi:xanthine dehydrogenase YagS FAD-binding subunit
VHDRHSYAFALVSVAAALDVDGPGVVRQARLALGGVAIRPRRVPAAERLLVGRKADQRAYRAGRGRAAGRRRAVP